MACLPQEGVKMTAWLETQSQLEAKAVGMPRVGQVGRESQLGVHSQWEYRDCSQGEGQREAKDSQG